MKPVRIDVHYSTQHMGQIQVYRRCQNSFQRRGIDLRFQPDRFPDVKSDADVLILQADFAGPNPENLSQRIIIEERADSSMPQARWLLGKDNVSMCFKVSVAQRKWLNLPVKRVHCWLLDSLLDWPERIILTEDQIAKVRPGFHFGMYPRLARRVDRARKLGRVNDWRGRPIDVIFIGNTQYSNATICRHRLAFCDTLQKINGIRILCIPRHIVSSSKYFEISRNAKIVVSPWGYGELCYRDFEALLDHCVLVKPRTDFVEVLGEPLCMDSYTPCQPDASDLEDCISRILGPSDEAAFERRQRSCNQILEWWDEERIVDWWCRETEITAC